MRVIEFADAALLNSVGVNSVNKSLGFLFLNQLDNADRNIYIAFPAHSLPETMLSLPFYFENVLLDQQETSRLVYFTVIGCDAVADVGVGVFDVNNPANQHVRFKTDSIVKIQSSISFSGYNVGDTFFLVANNNVLDNKEVQTTTVENFYFNGPNDMLQFMYPQSVLLQQPGLPGISGSPVVDDKLRLIGMVVAALSTDPNAEIVATSSSVLWTVLFHIILPRYLQDVALARQCPKKQTIVNSVDYAGSVCADGIPYALLGFVGQYLNQNSAVLCSQLEQLQSQHGFVITGFYRSYDLASNTISMSNVVKRKVDNTVLRIFSPFNPSTAAPSFLYRWITTAAVRCVVLFTIQYENKFTHGKQTLVLGNNGNGPTSDSVTTFLYTADPRRSFTVQYAYYDDQWLYRTETICPAQEVYIVLGVEQVSFTTELPPFIQGNMPVTTLYNLDQNGLPYERTLLRKFAYNKGTNLVKLG